MSKAYVLIRALIKVDVHESDLPTVQTELRDEVHSNLESVGEDVLMVTADAPPRDALEKLGENRDTYTLELAEKIMAGSVLISPTRGLLRAVGEDRDYWMRRFVDVNDAIGGWLNAIRPDDIDKGTLADSYKCFIAQHVALLDILEKGGLLGPVPRGYVYAAARHAQATPPAETPAAEPQANSPGKCGNCLMETVDVVALLPDGTCPQCGQNYSKGIPPRAAGAPLPEGRGPGAPCTSSDRAKPPARCLLEGIGWPCTEPFCDCPG